MNQIASITRPASSLEVEPIQLMAAEALNHDLSLSPFASGSEEHQMYSDELLRLQTEANKQVSL